mmetsp:Transcript_2922/g.4440  ORF Transcript_2922/g.4440 Transcript_2922/m.4440 type:complete len:447 (+) Transcript_2922:1385-2725(+)
MTAAAYGKHTIPHAPWGDEGVPSNGVDGHGISQVGSQQLVNGVGRREVAPGGDCKGLDEEVGAKKVGDHLVHLCIGALEPDLGSRPVGITVCRGEDWILGTGALAQLNGDGHQPFVCVYIQQTHGGCHVALVCRRGTRASHSLVVPTGNGVEDLVIDNEDTTACALLLEAGALAQQPLDRFVAHCELVGDFGALDETNGVGALEHLSAKFLVFLPACHPCWQLHSGEELLEVIERVPHLAHQLGKVQGQVHASLNSPLKEVLVLGIGELLLKGQLLVLLDGGVVGQAAIPFPLPYTSGVRELDGALLLQEDVGVVCWKGRCARSDGDAFAVNPSVGWEVDALVVDLDIDGGEIPVRANHGVAAADIDHQRLPHVGHSHVIHICAIPLKVVVHGLVQQLLTCAPQGADEGNVHTRIGAGTWKVASLYCQGVLGLGSEDVLRAFHRHR